MAASDACGVATVLKLNVVLAISVDRFLTVGATVDNPMRPQLLFCCGRVHCQPTSYNHALWVPDDCAVLSQSCFGLAAR